MVRMLLPALITITIKLIPTPIWEKCLKEAEDIWKDGKPKKWYYAIPIVVIWMLIIWIAIKELLKMQLAVTFGLIFFVE